MKRTVGDCIQLYLSKGLPALRRRLKRLGDKQATTQKAIFFGRARDNVLLFLEREESILPTMQKCDNVEKLSTLVYQTFKDIEGITDHTLNSYVYFKANLMELPLDTACETFIYPNVGEQLEQKGIVFSELKTELQRHYPETAALSDLECVDMVNRYPSIVRDYPY